MGGQQLGTDVRSAGDVNGDGIGDVLIVSAANIGPGGGAAVQVRSGVDGALLLEHNPEGPSPFGFPCYTAAWLGDVDGDDLDDLIVGSSNTNQARGVVRIVSGSTGAVLHEIAGDAKWQQVGAEVSGVGDANGDGVPDYAYVELWNSEDQIPRVVLCSGADHSILNGWDVGTALYTTRVDLAAVGDVDQDGHADLLVGFSRPPIIGPAGARVFSGADGSTLLSFEDASLASFGAWVGAPGDLDADGHPDVAVATPSGIDGQVSTVRFYSGAKGTLLFERTEPGGAGFGTSIDALGDVTMDGVPDVIIGAPHASGAAGYAHGRVGVYSSGLVLPHSKVIGTHAFGLFGWSAAGLGDVDQDGVPDFAVGEPGASAKRGAVHVLSGVAGESDGPLTFVPGDVLVGSIDAPDDDDRVRFTSLGGSKITFEAAPHADLAARLEVFGAALEPVAAWDLAPTASAKKVAFHVPADGVYEVVVSGLDGTTGAFEFHTGIKLKKNVQWVAATKKGTPDAPARVTFHGAPCMSLFGFVHGKKGFASAPAPFLDTPSGARIDLDLYSAAYDKTTSIGVAPLYEVGEYTLSAEGMSGGKAKVAFDLQIMPNFANNWVWID